MTTLNTPCPSSRFASLRLDQSIKTVDFETAIYLMQFDLQKSAALTRLFAMSFRCSSVVSRMEGLQLSWRRKGLKWSLTTQE